MKKTMTVLAIVIIVMSIFKVSVLQVVVADKGDNENKVLMSTLVDEGETFEVNWIHSVSKRPVIEKYKILETDKITIDEMKFDTFSANLPARPDYDTKWEYKKDHIRVYNYDVEFDEVPVVIGQVVADHILCIKNKVVYLRQLYRPGGFVHIKVKKMNFIKYIVKEGMR